MSKPLIFILSFTTYVVIHMMLMTYSFNKPSIAKIFQISDLLLGIMDSAIFIFLAIGAFFRYNLLNSNKPCGTLFWAAIPQSLSYLVIPLLAIGFSTQIVSAQQGAYITAVIIIMLAIFGFSQFAFFPSTLTIFSQNFTIKHDGGLAGVFSSKSNVGNIIGFLLANLLVYSAGIQWEITMGICSILLLLVTLSLYKWVPEKEQTKEPISFQEFLKYFKKIFKKPEFRFYILTFSIFKAIIYSYQFWTPKFLVSIGYQSYSGYVPMVFDISTLIGSTIMGKVYQTESNFNNNKSKIYLFLLQQKFVISSVIITIASFGYIFLPNQIYIYFILAALMGITLGAMYNSLESNEILVFTANDSRSTDMFSTANTCIGSAIVGIFQIIMGVVAHVMKNQIQQNNGNTIDKGFAYFVIAGMGIIAIIISLLKSTIGKKKKQQISQENQIQLQSNTKKQMMTDMQ